MKTFTPPSGKNLNVDLSQTWTICSNFAILARNNYLIYLMILRGLLKRAEFSEKIWLFGVFIQGTKELRLAPADRRNAPRAARSSVVFCHRHQLCE